MIMTCINYVLRAEWLRRRFNLPPALLPRIRQSWDNRRNEMITGRFDFSLSERGLKLYEYNCDSASCHMETGKVQGLWAKHHGCTEGRDSGEELFADLVKAWKKSGVSGVVHIMQDRDLEETYHALYMKSAMDAAGLDTRIVKGVSHLTWGEDGKVVDEDGLPICWVWKTWSWETALDQIRSQITQDDENLRLHKTIDRTTTPPRLVDVLLRPEVMVFEPLWTLIPSNKAMLPVLWMLYPHHPYLLNAQFEPTEALAAKGYVVKPIVGRSGENIHIIDGNKNTVSKTKGQFDLRDRIYQELFPLPRLRGANVQVSSFSVAGSFAGACVRVDADAILSSQSDILPLRIVADDAI